MNRPVNVSLHCEHSAVSGEFKRLKDKNIKLRYCLGGLAFLLVVLIIVYTVIAFLFNPQLRGRGEDSRHDFVICNRSECHELAEYLNDSIDYSIDPCDDFFAFVCGNSTSANNTADKFVSSTNSNTPIRIVVDGLTAKYQSSCQAVEFVKRFYQRCIEGVVDESDEIGLRSLLVKMGGIPLLEDNGTYRNRSMSWWEIQAILIREFSFYDRGNEEFSMGRLINVNIGKKQFNRPSLHAPLSDYFYDTSENKTSTFYVDVLCLLLLSECSTEKREKLLAGVNQSVQFEMRLFSMISKNDSKVESDVQLDALEIMVPALPWSDFLTDLLNSTSHPIEAKTIFETVDVQYYEALTKLLNETDREVVANYLGLHCLRAFAIHTMTDATGKTLFGERFDSYRKKKCYSILENVFPEALSRIFVDAVNIRSSKMDVKDIASDLQDAHASLIEESSWLNNEAKRTLKDKVLAVSLRLAYPQWITNNDVLNNYYAIDANVEATPFVDLLKAVLRFSTAEICELFHFPSFKTMAWTTKPYETNANFVREDNAVIVPAAMYTRPFYWRNGARAFNYGAIGLHIGRHLGNTFLDGDQLMGYDNFGNALTDSKRSRDGPTHEGLVSKRDCFLRQYRKAKNDTADPSSSTLSEVDDIVAESVGIRAAYKAYLRSGPEELLPAFKDLDDKKLFFIATANLRCPKQKMDDDFHDSKLRVHLAVINFNQFSNVFNCPQGSAMNEIEKCVLWN